MNIKKASIITAVTTGCIAVAALFFLTNSGAAPDAAVNQPRPEAEKPAAPAQPDAEATSDLDRSVEELWAAACEHKIPQYSCDECRYEVGAVKLAGTVIADAGKTGIVKIAAAERQPLSRALMLTGEVKENESATVRISAPLPGTVIKIAAGAGQRVAAGDLLFELDSTEVAEAKGDYLKRTASVKLAKKAAEREAALFAKKVSAEIDAQEAQAKFSEEEIELRNAATRLERLGLSQQEILALANSTAGKLTGRLAVPAPLNGTVLEKNVSAGERVEAGKEIILLSDLATVWVWADIKEADLPAVQQAGEKIACEVDVPAAGGRRYPGTLEAVSGKMDEQTRTVKARISVANPDGFLRPGMFVNIKLLLSTGSSAVAVPKVAVLADAGRCFVFTHKEGDYWIRRPVTVGETGDAYAEIKDGLAVGQKVIADGSFLLKSDVLRKKMGAGCAD